MTDHPCPDPVECDHEARAGHAEAERDGAYRERAHLLALLAAVYPSHMQPDPAEPDWPVLYLSLPTGQATWHIAPGDLPLFDHVRRDVTEPWDGHSTPEKYRRVARAAAERARLHQAGGSG